MISRPTGRRGKSGTRKEALHACMHATTSRVGNPTIQPGEQSWQVAIHEKHVKMSTTVIFRYQTSRLHVWHGMQYASTRPSGGSMGCTRNSQDLGRDDESPGRGFLSSFIDGLSAISFFCSRTSWQADLGLVVRFIFHNGLLIARASPLHVLCVMR